MWAPPFVGAHLPCVCLCVPVCVCVCLRVACVCVCVVLCSFAHAHAPHGTPVTGEEEGKPREWDLTKALTICGGGITICGGISSPPLSPSFSHISLLLFSLFFLSFSLSSHPQTPNSYHTSIRSLSPLSLRIPPLLATILQRRQPCCRSRSGDLGSWRGAFCGR